MNRLSRVAVLLQVVPVVAASAGAGPIGGVIVIAGSDNDLVAIPVVVVILILVAVAVANRFRKQRCS